MDLVPDPQFRRVMLPGRVAPPPRPQYRNQTMSVTCPKCKASFRHPHGLGALFCKAADPPYFGPARGCGWLLAVVRPYEGGSQGRADAVMDCTRWWRPDRGDFYIPRDILKRVFAAVYERWERRGFGKVIVREDGSLDFEEYGPTPLADIATTTDGKPLIPRP